VHRQPLELGEDADAEGEAQGADDQSSQEQAAAGHAEELDAGEIGEHQLRFVGTGGERKGEDREGGQGAADDVSAWARGSNQSFRGAENRVIRCSCKVRTERCDRSKRRARRARRGRAVSLGAPARLVLELSTA